MAPHPPFSVYVEFLSKACIETSNRNYDDKGVSERRVNRVLHTVHEDSRVPACKSSRCPLHPNGDHNFADCRTFIKLPFAERKKKIADFKRCFKCLSDDGHRRQECSATVSCEVCHKPHHTLMHIYTAKPESGSTSSAISRSRRSSPHAQPSNRGRRRS